MNPPYPTRFKVPFERVLKAGEIVKIKPVSGYKAIFKVSTAGCEKATVSCVPFKGGDPLMNPSLSTFLLKTGERTRITRKETPHKADEIVIRCKDGKVKVVAMLEEAPEGVILKKYYLKSNHGRSFSVNARKKVRLIIIDDVKDKTDTTGEAVFYQEIERKFPGGIAYDKKELERVKFSIKNGSRKMFEYSEDKKLGTISVNIVKGGAEIRVEQPTRAGSIPPSWKN